MKRVHIISIGGSVMHNLAIILKRNGYIVSGSDDEIYNPSRSRLEENGLLPESMGWDPDRINSDIDFIILGMHARKDNPEIKKALELGIRMYSYPEFIHDCSRDKQRIVVAGSHGKTTTTSLIMKALMANKIDFDYLIGAKVEGFDDLLKLSDAPIIIIEGDEYLSSAIDRRPKFLHYKPTIAIITGIDWDHINVFPSFQKYLLQFELFIKGLSSGATLIYHYGDRHVKKLVQNIRPGTEILPYQALDRNVKDEILVRGHAYQINLFGEHNDQNIHAALIACHKLGIDDDKFFKSLESFKGADRRLELIYSNPIVYYDFAHAPSKVRATVSAVKKKYPSQKLVCVFELHTFSSLNKVFLPQYNDSLRPANQAIIFCNRNTFVHKNLDVLEAVDITSAFNDPQIQVIYDVSELQKQLELLKNQHNAIILIMSSGNLGGLDVKQIFA